MSSAACSSPAAQLRVARASAASAASESGHSVWAGADGPWIRRKRKGILVAALGVLAGHYGYPAEAGPGLLQYPLRALDNAETDNM